MRHLAWWLFTRDDAQSAVTEREMIAATTEFLHGRGFEAQDDARAAAEEFVEFCRGRMWVFSDAGTTASGERLYAFTHRTFLEYFAAAQVAYDSDTLLWRSRMDAILRAHATEVTEAAEEDFHLRNVAVWQGFISARQALEMPGGLSALFLEPWSFMASWQAPYLDAAYESLLKGWPAFTAANVVGDLQAVGEHLRDHPDLPWVHHSHTRIADTGWEAPEAPASKPGPFDATACLGGAAMLAIQSEYGATGILDQDPQRFGPLGSIFPYLKRRVYGAPDAEFPDLPVPEEFRQVFRDWAEGRVDFTEPG